MTTKKIFKQEESQKAFALLRLGGFSQVQALQMAFPETIQGKPTSIGTLASKHDRSAKVSEYKEYYLDKFKAQLRLSKDKGKVRDRSDIVKRINLLLDSNPPMNEETSLLKQLIDLEGMKDEDKGNEVRPVIYLPSRSKCNTCTYMKRVLDTE